MSLPTRMRAMVLTGHGDMDRLQFHDDWPVPQPMDDEVLIRVGACGLNNTDVNTRSAWYSKGVSAATTGAGLPGADDEDASWGGAPITFPRIQGADVAGKVVAAPGSAGQALLDRRVMVDPWVRESGDDRGFDVPRYFGSECDGGFAEYVCVPARQVHAVDSTLTDAELATFPTACVTAENMLNRAAVGRGDTVLIPGASGGVGSALIQLARRRGARTVAMCSEAKAAAVRAAGADAVLPRNPVDLRSALRNAIGAESVSVVADVVGGDAFGALIDALERGGRYTCAGAIAGPVVQLDLRTFYLRDLTFTGATVVPVGVFADLVRYIEDGELEPLLAATWPLEELHDAQRAFIEKRHVGNIVVTP